MKQVQAFLAPIAPEIPIMSSPQIISLEQINELERKIEALNS
jgi:isochorismate synthase EntC